MFAAASGSPTSPTPPPTPLTLSLQTSGWQTLGSPDPYPLSNDNAALALDFPNSGGSINYLFASRAVREIRGTLVVSLRVDTTGPVVFEFLSEPSNCGIPASVRPMIWANGNGSSANDRWWSNPRSYALASGAATVSVPISSESWSNVNGTYGNASTAVGIEFSRAVRNVSSLGLTFGGGCSFGHGVFVRNGTARLTLTEFAIR